MEDNTDNEINATIKDIEKLFGKGSIITSKYIKCDSIPVVSTGSLLLNNALGIGGFPKGRIIEIFGPESAGKTTLALLALAQVQKLGKKVAFIDAEHALDPQYTKKLGINLEDFLLSQPDSGEQALDILEMLIKSQVLEMIVIDSVAALVPQVELDGCMNDQTIGAQARLMSRALRKIAPAIAKSNCTVIFINQIREKIGVIYGSAEITPGGRALKFYSSIRLDVRKGEQLIQNQQVIGHKIKIKIVKNKLSPPYKIVFLDFYFQYGISIINELIDLAVENKVITKLGSWYSFENLNLGQGKEKVKDYLEKNNEILEKIKLKIKL